MKKPFPFLLVLLPLFAALVFAGCETPGRGAKYGALIGAAAGGLSERSIEGAAAGAAIGAGAGALFGFLSQRERGAYYDGDRYLDEPGYYDDDGVYYPERRRSRVVYREEHRRGGYGEDDLPYGRPTRTPGLVKSPYRPYTVIDVSGVPPGAKVLDASSGRVFLNP